MLSGVGCVTAFRQQSKKVQRFAKWRGGGAICLDLVTSGHKHAHRPGEVQTGGNGPATRRSRGAMGELQPEQQVAEHWRQWRPVALYSRAGFSGRLCDRSPVKGGAKHWETASQGWYGTPSIRWTWVAGGNTHPAAHTCTGLTIQASRGQTPSVDGFCARGSVSGAWPRWSRRATVQPPSIKATT